MAKVFLLSICCIWQLLLVSASNITRCSTPEEEATVTLPFPLNYIIVLFLILLSALFSGLTLGLLGLDKIGLEIVISGDNPKLAECARQIKPVRDNGNLLLCTLLLGNVATNSLLSILMADMTSGIIGFASSTILIVIFGEIIPQATCSRHALVIGKYSLPVVKFFIALMYIMAKPLSMALDYALGEEIGTIHSRNELRKMMAIHVQHGAVDVESGTLMDGALKYRDMMVRDVMTPASEVFMLSIQERLSFRVLSEIFKAGYSRIPVFDRDRNDIVGLMLTKDLLFIDPEDETPVRNFISIFGRSVQVVWPDQKLGDVLKVFKQGRGHMAVVRDVDNSGPGDPFYVMLGIITLEDIIEEILGEEIVDETDVFVDEENRVTNVASRDRDFARLKMLSGNISDERLTMEEIKAIAAYLVNNVAQVQSYFTRDGGKMSLLEIQDIISRCPVVDVSRQSHVDLVASNRPVPEDILYRRGKMSNTCSLILSGKVVILAGKDEFRSELGPWSILGGDALEVPEGTYIPDYTAFVASDKVRYLRITQAYLKPDASTLYKKTPQRKGTASLSREAAKEMVLEGTPVGSRGYDMLDSGDSTVSPMWQVPERSSATYSTKRSASASIDNGIELESKRDYNPLTPSENSIDIWEV